MKCHPHFAEIHNSAQTSTLSFINFPGQCFDSHRLPRTKAELS